MIGKVNVSGDKVSTLVAASRDASSRSDHRSPVADPAKSCLTERAGPRFAC